MISSASSSSIIVLVERIKNKTSFIVVSVVPMLTSYLEKSNNPIRKEMIYTILQNKRMRRCGVPTPLPPPIIFERLKLLQQIIYPRKGNLSESPNHKKYWRNILISRFYEQFSRSSGNLCHFWKFEKISNS